MTDSEKAELEALRAITRCKYFFLNPKYPIEQQRPTYLPCSLVVDHKGPCK